MENDDVMKQKKHVLKSREQRTVRAFAEVFIEGCEESIGPEEITRNVGTYLAGVRSNRTSSLRLILFLIEHVLPRLWWPFRPSFSNLSISERKRLIQERLQNPRLPRLFRDLARVKSLFIIGYYGDARVYDSINFIPVKERVQFQPDKLISLSLPRLELTHPTGSEINCEICVIGSGAGGAVVAHNMAAAGKDVVLLEEGPYALAEQLVHHEATIMPRLYKEGGLQATVDQDMLILQG
jgi:hypothetical protein